MKNRAENPGLPGHSPDAAGQSGEDSAKKTGIPLRPGEGFFGDVPPVLKNNQQPALRVFIDGPVVEAFATDRACMTYLMAADRPDAGGLAVLAEGNPVIIKTADVWEISSL
ncbi:MAG: GH32 C-terminal domain-containing protein [Planctomycetes bacterium]|nr:GH32 C-terminal domain-containing protein [Planctomycetota bacterium]